MDCPFIDADKHECSGRLNMGHLNDALALCAGKYFLCPLYLELCRSSEMTGTLATAAPVAAAGPAGLS